MKKYSFLLFILILFCGCFNSSISENSSQNSTADIPSNKKLVKEIRNPLYISTDLGANWEAAGQNLPLEIEGSFMEKYGNEIILATDNLGLFISLKNKTEWKQIGKDLPSKKINALYVSDNEIFVGVYRKGIFSSKNQGASWENLNFDLPNFKVQCILKIKNEIIVGTDIGIYNLDKNKNTWVRSFNGVQAISLNQAGKKLVAGTNQGTLLSEDQGKTWEWIHRKGAAHNTAILDEKIIVMNISGDIFISEDWGKNWLDVDYFPRKGSYVYETVFQNNTLIMSNNYGVYQSKDGGKNWNLVFKNEAYAFLDFLIIEDKIYGTTRTWKEYRGKLK